MPGNNDHLPPDEVLVPILRQVGAGDLAAVLATCRAFYRLRTEYLLPVLRRKFRGGGGYKDYADAVMAGLQTLQEVGADGNRLAVVAVGRALVEAVPASWRRASPYDRGLLIGEIRGVHEYVDEVPLGDVAAYLSYEALRLLMADPAPPAAARFFAQVMAERMASAANYLNTMHNAIQNNANYHSLDMYKAFQWFKVWEERVGAVCQLSVLSWSPGKLPALRALSSELIGRGAGIGLSHEVRIKGFSVEYSLHYRHNPLHVAAATVEDSALLAVLASVGFDPEGEDSNGLTPSDHAEAAGLVGNVATLAALAASRRAEK